MAAFGSLSRDQLLAAWRAGSDRSYTDPLDVAGDGRGLEVFSSSAAQLERASIAADRTFQSIYVLPWSGQSDVPASGPSRSSVELTFVRTQRLQEPLVLATGSFIDELAADWGETGTTYVLTGRRYTLRADVVFVSGDPGPIKVWADAELPGRGYDSPQPGTISVIDQSERKLQNDTASITWDPGQWTPNRRPIQGFVIGQTQPDMFVPENVGQYVQFVSGANAGKVFRIGSWLPSPNPAMAGTIAVVDPLLSIESDGYTGGFVVGERVTINTLSPGPVPTAAGTIVASEYSTATGNLRTLLRLDFANGYAVGQQLFGASYSARVDAIMHDPVLTPEFQTAAWRVLDWFADMGLEVTNVTSPTGGALGVLDEIGAERGVHRSAPSEPDDVYRQRVAQPADAVSPNAIRRALYRSLGPSAIFCLREVGQAGLPGTFYDGAGLPPSAIPGRAESDCYDVDTALWDGTYLVGTFQFQEPVVYKNAAGDVLQYGWMGAITLFAGIYFFTMIRRQTTQGRLPSTPGAFDTIVGLQSHAILGVLTGPVFSANYAKRRFRMLLDYQSFRAFFCVGLPSTGAGEFGFAYDDHAYGFYDLEGTGWDNFYDGYPVGEATRNLAAFKVLAAVRAAGVGFELYREDIECP